MKPKKIYLIQLTSKARAKMRRQRRPIENAPLVSSAIFGLDRCDRGDPFRKCGEFTPAGSARAYARAAPATGTAIRGISKAQS
jgi:hypothetical protein